MKSIVHYEKTLRACLEFQVETFDYDTVLALTFSDKFQVLDVMLGACDCQAQKSDQAQVAGKGVVLSNLMTAKN